jgi:hypothetical protein
MSELGDPIDGTTETYSGHFDGAGSCGGPEAGPAVLVGARFVTPAPAKVERSTRP